MQKDYKVIVNSVRETFDKLVTQYLNEGWYLHGSAKLTISPGGTPYFTQAIIKQEINES